MNVFFENKIPKEKLPEINPLVFAFIGDAVHTLFVRDHIFSRENLLVKNHHNLAIKLCNAKNQSEALDNLEPHLTDEEKTIVRRARNTKKTHTAKNATEEEYNKATSYEALVGYHYIQGNQERVKFLLEKSIK